MLKKSILVLVAISNIIFTTSCSNDDDNTPPTTDGNINGQWQLSEVASKNGKSVFEIGGQKISSDFELKGSDYNMDISFDKDNILEQNGTYVQNTTTTSQIEGQPITETESEEVDILFLPGNWTKEGNTLTINSINDIKRVYNIVELSENNLKLSIDLKDYFDVSNFLDLDGAEDDDEPIFVITPEFQGELVIQLER